MSGSGSQEERRPFSLTPVRENRNTPNTPNRLLFGAPPPIATTSSVLSSTGLGLASSPSPYLLRSPDIGDYFSATSFQSVLGNKNNESPLASRHTTSSAISGSADDDEPISWSRFGMIRRRSSK